jgi:hypothetical protein
MSPHSSRLALTGWAYLNDPEIKFYSASHSRVAPENVGLQREQKYNIFACHICNDVRLCVLGIHIRKLATRKETVAQPAETLHSTFGLVLDLRVRREARNVRKYSA